MKGVLAVSLLSLAGSALGAATTCTRLTDSKASIYSAVSYIADKDGDLANLPLYKMMAPIDKELPWLSTCLGSANVLTVGLGLLANPNASQCLSSLTGTGGTGFSMTPTANGTEGGSVSSLCASMNTTLFPCVDTILVKAVNALIASGGDCCADMAKKLPELFGQDLKGFLSSLMVRFGDVLCSVKTTVDAATGGKTTETCAANLMGILGSGQGLENILQMIQLPNDQACAAMKGETFTATGGASYKFFADQEALDSCFAPMNLLFTDLAKLPLVTQSDFASAFTAGQCLAGESIIAWALKEEGMVQGFAQAFDAIVSDMKLMTAGEATKIVRAGFEDMQKDFGPMCFHLPNSVSDCAYDTSVVYAFSSDTPPPSGGSGGSGTPEPSGSASTAHGGIAGVSLVVVMVSAWLALRSGSDW